MTVTQPVNELYYCDRCKTNRTRSQTWDKDFVVMDSIGQYHYHHCTVCNDLTDAEVAENFSKQFRNAVEPPNSGQQSKIETVFSRADAGALLALGRVLAFGEAKYQYKDVPIGQENWRKIKHTDHIDHAIEHILRHYLELQNGPAPGDEEATQHLAHAFCRIMFALGVPYEYNEIS